MHIQLQPQNKPESLPRTFGQAVLVDIQATFLPLISKLLGHRDHAVIQAILKGLGMDEMISWNQSIWVPQDFGRFLTMTWRVFGPEVVEEVSHDYQIPVKDCLQMQTL
jgi:hypothetical protein